MKKSLYILCFLLLAQVMIAWMSAATKHNEAGTLPANLRNVSSAISCSPGSNENIRVNKNGKFISVLPGWGNHFYKISTTNDSAQLYFNQGLTMYYSYHMKEALASFKEAARFDSTCAMLYWAQLLAMGPYYNNVHGYSMSNEVPRVLQLMNNNNSEQATPNEKDLIQAMNSRYDPADIADKQRKQHNISYADAMKQLAVKYNNDPDIQSLYIDAQMLVHPWDFWNNDGSPKSWTPELLQICEAVLKQNAQHPAGLHYYIHITEASRKPEVALPNADSLLKLFPGIAHMVHMSSHEYERIGYFEKGVHANEAADESLGQYATIEEELNLMKHSNHYYAVGTYCALSGAMYKLANQRAAVLRKSANPSAGNIYDQYLYMFPNLAMVRMGKWQDILNDSTLVNPEWTYASLLNNFAKGMAYAKSGDARQAKKCLEQLREYQKDNRLKARFVPHMSSPYECSVVAEYILLGNIKFSERKYKDAIKAIGKAIQAEDKLIYTEPKLWMLPARQYMGAFLLQMNQPAKAESVYREDLLWNPGNGWSLLGLYQSLEAQQKVKELEALKARYLYSFSAADVLPVVSAY
ncbi:MAG: tetratricopeptide repeat protein [Agriterribacter sp.]